MVMVGKILCITVVGSMVPPKGITLVPVTQFLGISGTPIPLNASHLLTRNKQVLASNANVVGTIQSYVLIAI